MTDKVNFPCAECFLLGNTTPPKETASFESKLDTSKSLIFFTINPDSKLKIGKSFYNDLSIQEQCNIIHRTFREVLKKYRNKYRLNIYSIHYEITKNYNLHAHGLIVISDEFKDTQLPLVDMSKAIHQKLGRPKVSSRVCARLEWVRDIEKITEYLNKENILPCTHSSIYKEITDYLVPEETE